jgi:energy-coupling factor transport system permease protein
MREGMDRRGPGAEPVGRPAMARRLVEGSLDRAVDVAATLELRGHSLGVRPQRRRERSRDDVPLYLAAAAIVAVALAALAAGAGGFDTYPTISMDAGALTLALCASLIGLAATPFGVRRWRSRG